MLTGKQLDDALALRPDGRCREVVHDLFGEVPPSPPKVSTAGQAHGYAAMPGTGPKGETCGSCAHLYRKRMGKTYLKCALMQAKWTGGHGTDVRSRSPACSKWESDQHPRADGT